MRKTHIYVGRDYNATKKLVSEEIKEEIRKYLEISENYNTTFPNVDDTVKAVIR